MAAGTVVVVVDDGDVLGRVFSGAGEMIGTSLCCGDVVLVGAGRDPRAVGAVVTATFGATEVVVGSVTGEVVAVELDSPSDGAELAVATTC